MPCKVKVFNNSKMQKLEDKLKETKNNIENVNATEGNFNLFKIVRYTYLSKKPHNPPPFH